jgi:hypothetical protein
MKTYAITSYSYAHNWQNTMCTMQLLVTTWMKTNLQLFYTADCHLKPKFIFTSFVFPSLLYNGYRVFPGGKVQLGCDADPSPPSSAEVKNRVKLHLYSP